MASDGLNPLQINASSFNVNSSDVLVVKPGDELSLHDTANGLETVIDDQTTGQLGSMMASAGNGFGTIRV